MVHGGTKSKISAFDAELVKKTTHQFVIDSDIGDSEFTTKNMTVDILQRLIVATKIANYSVVDTDEIVLGDATAGIITFTLPTAVGRAGKKFTFKKIDVSGNNVVIDGAGAETIDGVATNSLAAQFAKVTIISDNVNWLVIA